MKLKFPQFNAEITDPTVTINLNTIGDRAIDKLLSVDVVLETESAKFGVRAEEMPYTSTWEDESIPGMVSAWLETFEV
jgi:hypothetical protein